MRHSPGFTDWVRYVKRPPRSGVAPDSRAMAAAGVLRQYLELCKLRIGMMIGITAMVGYGAIAPQIDGWALLGLGCAMMLGSSSSSVFNHFYDRDLDRLMTRTARRPLARGSLGNPWSAVWLAAVLLVAGLVMAAGLFNWVVALHLFLGAFIYGVVYTIWLKRRTWLNIVVGGAAGSFALLAGAAAADPQQWLLPTLMAVTLFLWTPSHFWALAILLKDDYARAGVPMLPVLIGTARCARWILVNSVLLVLSSLLPWLLGELGAVYGLLSLAFGGHFLWLSWRLAREPGPLWARRTFFGSMQYLCGVFLAVIADRHLTGLF
ncbi:heme o synthase [Insolitispirillum peregrinum]|uniref:heme o synthase n=1 Tax=Insolitispirillum peregrinum TaxID=80876 RepID=UPI00360E3BDC